MINGHQGRKAIWNLEGLTQSLGKRERAMGVTPWKGLVTKEQWSGTAGCCHALYISEKATSLTTGFPCNSAGKESSCNDAGDPSSIPGLGRSPGEGNGYSLQYSGLENSMDCIVHGVAKAGHD